MLAGGIGDNPVNFLGIEHDVDDFSLVQASHIMGSVVNRDAPIFGDVSRDSIVSQMVQHAVEIPVAVKLSPYFSSLAHFAARAVNAGADGLVLFNRFYQPDIDLEALEVVPKVELSTSQELLLRLRWLSILSPHTQMSLACSGGVHTPTDAIKALMCGAHAVQLVSCLLKHGVGCLTMIKRGVAEWMEQHEYASLTELHGSMNLSRCPDPTAFERANYMRTLQSWPPRDVAGVK